ncbi:MAG: hypothetical protein AMS22_11460 [Thiotrichales bacterium SG8_50]|nr:MAG: hypothetical protein AMS22_11460 [Thiotrichales bacterium SG8_50]
MKKSVLTILAIFGLVAASSAMAGTTGVEFQAFSDWLNAAVNGFLGRALAVSALIGGVLFAIARNSVMPGVAGLIVGVFLFYAPTILNALFTAVI